MINGIKPLSPQSHEGKCFDFQGGILESLVCQHMDTFVTTYLYSFQPLSLVTTLVQELNMVTNTTRIQSPGSKHSLINIKSHHSEDQSAVEVIWI